MNPNLQVPAYAITYVTFTFGTLANLIRLYARGFVQRTWGLDDYFVIGVLVGRVRETPS